MEPLSKTQKKKEALSLQELGERLVKLSAEQLKKIDLPVDMFNAVILAKKISKHGGLARQMQYIGTLMRKHDPKPIQEALQRIEEGGLTQSSEHKTAEKWRDELIAGNDRLIGEITTNLPHADQQHLAGLVRKAREDHADKGLGPKAARALFRYLHKTLQQPKHPVMLQPPEDQKVNHSIK